jgi:hypothetical protein
MRTRQRRGRELSDPEGVVWGLQAVAFLGAALAIGVLLPWNRAADPLLLVALAALLALFTWIEFEVGTGCATPAQLVFLPLVFLAPLPLVPLLVALGLLLEKLPNVLLGKVHVTRWLWALSDAWFAVGPVLVLAALAPGEPRAELAGVYAVAFAAQVATGAGPTALGQVLTGDAWRDSARSVLSAQLVDALLTPAGLALAYAAVALGPLGLAGLFPLGLLLARLARLHNGYWRAVITEEQARWARVVADQRRSELSSGRLSGISSIPEHWRCVLELAPAVAAELGQGARFCRELALTARVHDLAKRQFPLDDVLRSQRPLGYDNWALVRAHPRGDSMLLRLGPLIGDRLATPVEPGTAVSARFSWAGYRRASMIVRSTHERWDGSGYPDGLRGTEIPLPARIIACCDAYSAMTAPRPYRAAMAQEAALQEIRRAAGTQFDPDICRAVERVLDTRQPSVDWTPKPAYRPLGWPAAAARQLAGR